MRESRRPEYGTLTLKIIDVILCAIRAILYLYLIGGGVPNVDFIL